MICPVMGSILVGVDAADLELLLELLLAGEDEGAADAALVWMVLLSSATML